MSTVPVQSDNTLMALSWELTPLPTWWCGQGHGQGGGWKCVRTVWWQQFGYCPATIKRTVVNLYQGWTQQSVQPRSCSCLVYIRCLRVIGLNNQKDPKIKCWVVRGTSRIIDQGPRCELRKLGTTIVSLKRYNEVIIRLWMYVKTATLNSSQDILN